LFRIY